MSTITTPIGKIASSKTQQKKYVVSEFDEFDSFAEDLEFQQQAEKSSLSEAASLIAKAKKAKEEVPVETKNKLEVLIGLKKKIKSINIDGHSISLKALTGGEVKKVFEYLSSFKDDIGIVQAYKSRHVILAYSIYSIDGEKVEDLLGDDDCFENRLAIVENISEEVLSDLHSFYEKEIVVKTPSNEQEVKEAIENIKK